MRPEKRYLPDLNIVRVALEIRALIPTPVTYRAIAGKTGLAVEQVRAAVYGLREHGAIRIEHRGRYAFVVPTAYLNRYLKEKTKFLKFEYAKDWRTVREYKKDIMRGHELERAVAPYVAEMLGLPSGTPHTMYGSDASGRFFTLEDAHKITSRPDVLIKVGNRLVELQGMYQQYPFCDFKAYKIYRALSKGGIFIQVDTVNKKYAVVTPQWIKNNGRYILHPTWSALPTIKKFAYRVDYASMPWHPLPHSLVPLVEQIRQKYSRM